MKPECSRVMDSLGGPLPADLESHVASCEDCRALVGGFDVLGGAPVAPTARTAPMSPAPAPRLETARQVALKELAAHPKPTPWWRELLVLLAVYAGVFLGGLFLLGRDGLVGNLASPLVIAVVALLTLLLVGGGALVAVAPTWRRLPWGLVALGAVGVAAVQLVGGSGQQGRVRPLLAGAMGCMGSELLLSVLPVAAALVLLSRSAFQPARALAAGLSAAGVSLLVLHLHCSDGTLAHLLVAHVVPWLLLAGVVVLVRSRLPTHSYAP
ncbi:NrsF family protein [Pyxidicoccus xibeiensis]|uniref:NrsF family protein n=1 Tax=Pyxidicoccus xibeiensis TaxID=2906759 RepID=UPI0020A7BACC|nr:NrsF family protein [Pyxidicoccus xibeiensis]MCP3141624.1 NrsF family protein [Pyxidicoccus xibeiensis]